MRGRSRSKRLHNYASWRRTSTVSTWPIISVRCIRTWNTVRLGRQMEAPKSTCPACMSETPMMPNLQPSVSVPGATLSAKRTTVYDSTVPYKIGGNLYSDPCPLVSRCRRVCTDHDAGVLTTPSLMLHSHTLHYSPREMYHEKSLPGI